MVFDTIRELFADQLEIREDEMNMGTDIVGDLGEDSLDMVELIMGVENEYGIVITDEAVHGFRTVGDVVEFIENALDK